MKFSAEFIEKVLQANNLVDVIAQYTQLTSKGGDYMGRCPFPDHPEKTPSFSVSASKQVYFCFGCHKKGNLFTFLQEFSGMSFPEAVEYLAERAHISLPVNEDFKEQDQISHKKKQLLKINFAANEFFVQKLKTLPANHPTTAYIQKRGLSAEVIEKFNIGYAPPEWDGLCQFLEKKSFPLTLAEEAKLARARTQGKSGYYDLFRDRLMFPIQSPSGEVLGFGGRVILQGEPKYLNSPESLVFHKSYVLYGLAQTARFIRAEDQIIIVEGYMDLVSLYQAGITNVAATMGTALTEEHAKLIGRMTKNVVVLFDGDNAGQNAAERSLPILLKAGLHPKGYILPDELDPDDYIKQHGASALKQQLTGAPELFTLILNLWLKNYKGTPSEKIKMCDLMSPIFQQIEDRRLHSLYLKEAANKLNVEEAWLFKSITSPNQSPKQKSHQVLQQPAKTVSGEGEKIKIKDASLAEKTLLSLALSKRELFEDFLTNESFQYVLHEGVKLLLTKAESACRQDPEKFAMLVGLFVNLVDDSAALFTQKSPEQGLGKLMSEENEQKLVQDSLRKLKDNYFKVQTEKLIQELKIEATEVKKEKLMAKLVELQKDRLALNQK